MKAHQHAATNTDSRPKTVGDIICQRKHLSFREDAPVGHVIRDMHRLGTGAAGVLDGKGLFSGLLTERDILSRIYATEPDPLENMKGLFNGVNDWRAGELMRTNPTQVPVAADLETTLDKMLRSDQFYMPVIDTSRNQFCGILTLRELFVALRQDISHTIECQDTLLAYFMHHENYGIGAIVPARIRRQTAG